MVDSTRKKRSDGHPFLPERHLTILVGLLVLLVLVFSFIILGISVNQIVNGTVDALNTQAETVAEQTVDLFDNYSRLCETLTANQNLKDFAAYSGQESEETLIVAGYPLRKDLNSLVALYGDDINTLAVYFPGNGSVITMARQVNNADAHLFFDSYSSLSPASLQAIPAGENWSLHFPDQDDHHSYVIRRVSNSGVTIAYVILEYSLSGFTERIAPKDGSIFISHNDTLVFSSSKFPIPSDLFEMARQNKSFELDGKPHTASWQQSQLAGLEIVAGIPTESFVHIRITLLAVMLAAGLLVICCLAVLGLWLNRQLFTPIENLIAASPNQSSTSTAISSFVTDLSETKLANDSLQRERDSILPLALGRQLERLIQTEDPEEILLNSHSCLLLTGLGAGEGYALFAVCCAEDRGGFFSKMQHDPRLRSQQGLFHYLLNNVLYDLLFQDFPGTVAPFRNNWFLVIVSCGSAAEVEQVQTIVETLLSTYESTFDTLLLTTRTCHGTTAKDFGTIVRSLAQETSYLEFWGGEQDGNEMEGSAFPPYRQFVHKLFARLELQDYESISSLLDSLFSQFLSGRVENIRITRHRIYALAALILTGIDEQLEGNREFAVSHHFEERLYRTHNITDFKKELADILAELAEYKKDQNATTGTGRLEEVRQYILAHYTENDLTAASIAASFSMSSSYLSRAFKEYTGSNILEYIQRLRVNTAKELLRTESVKTTAQQVGFWDTQGLVRAFKKHEGMTPSEFKHIREKK